MVVSKLKNELQTKDLELEKCLQELQIVSYLYLLSISEYVIAFLFLSITISLSFSILFYPQSIIHALVHWNGQANRQATDKASSLSQQLEGYKHSYENLRRELEVTLDRETADRRAREEVHIFI